MDLKEMIWECMGRIELAQDREKRCDVVKALRNILVA
jgi:hypothetical protein